MPNKKYMLEKVLLTPMSDLFALAKFLVNVNERPEFISINKFVQNQ